MKKVTAEAHKQEMKERRERQLARGRRAGDPMLIPQGKYIPAGEFKNTKPENR